MNHQCVVISRLENFKFRQYLSNIISRLLLRNQGPGHMPRIHCSLKAYCAIISRLIYMVLEMNLLIFSDMNISTKRLYSVHEIYFCTQLTPSNFI